MEGFLRWGVGSGLPASQGLESTRGSDPGIVTEAAPVRLPFSERSEIAQLRTIGLYVLPQQLCGLGIVLREAQSLPVLQVGRSCEIGRQQTHIPRGRRESSRSQTPDSLPAANIYQFPENTNGYEMTFRLWSQCQRGKKNPKRSDCASIF